MAKWEGSLQNRLEENRMFCDRIEVGTGMTQYLWSDRYPFEVVAVKDQKHVTVRKLEHEHEGDGVMDNCWRLFSNPANPEITLVKRGRYWYEEMIFTREDLQMLPPAGAEVWTDNEIFAHLVLANNGVDPKELEQRGEIRRYHRWDVSFGKAEYHYDYEF